MQTGCQQIHRVDLQPRYWNWSPRESVSQRRGCGRSPGCCVTEEPRRGSTCPGHTSAAHSPNNPLDRTPRAATSFVAASLFFSTSTGMLIKEPRGPRAAAGSLGDEIAASLQTCLEPVKARVSQDWFGSMRGILLLNRICK